MPTFMSSRSCVGSRRNHRGSPQPFRLSNVQIQELDCLSGDHINAPVQHNSRGIIPIPHQRLRHIRNQLATVTHSTARYLSVFSGTISTANFFSLQEAILKMSEVLLSGDDWKNSSVWNELTALTTGIDMRIISVYKFANCLRSTISYRYV